MLEPDRDPVTADAAAAAEAVAAEHEWTVVRLRLTALVLTVAMATVALRLGTPRSALWSIPLLPFLWSADIRIGAQAAMVRGDVDAAEVDALGPDQLAAASPMLAAGDRAGFYLLLALASFLAASHG